MAEKSERPGCALNVTVDKYTVIQRNDGSLIALRHGQERRDLTGDNLILALAQEVRELREQLQAWFHATPQGEDHGADEPAPYTGPGTGIFVRDHGSIKEIMEEEWAQRQVKKGGA